MSIITINNAKERAYYEAATNAIGRALEPQRIYLPRDFLEIISESATPNADLKNFKSSLGFSAMHRPDHASECRILSIRLAMKGMEAVHDQWRVENVVDFHQPEHEEERYQFLPFLFVGYKAAIRCYEPFVSEILKVLDLVPPAGTLLPEYQKRQQLHFAKLPIETEAMLARFLNAAKFDAHQSVLQRLNRDKAAADKVAAEVVEHSPGLFRKS